MTERIVEWLLSGVGAVALLFIGLYLKRISEDSRNNADSINSVSANVARIHNQLIQQFVSKEEFHPFYRRVDDLEQDVTKLQMHTGLEVRR